MKSHEIKQLLDKQPLRRLETISISNPDKYFCTVDGLLYSGDKERLLFCPRGRKGVLVIPDGTKSISDISCSACSFSVLVFPDSVESIGVFACYRNANLERVEGGKGIIKIYNGAFLNCQKLKYFELGDMVEEIGDSAFMNTTLTEIDLPDSIWRVGRDAFNTAALHNGKNADVGPDGMYDISIPSSIGYIQPGAFSNAANVHTSFVNRKLINACLRSGNLQHCYPCNMWRLKIDGKIAKTFDFTEMQADAILDMRLSRLIGLELEALKKENEKTKQNIEKYTKILSDKRYMKKVIKDDLEHIIKEYGQPRKTSIKNIEKAVIKKEAPKAFKEVVLMDKFGYVRAVSDTVYEKNKEAADSESKWVIPVMSDDKVVFITENGIMHTVPANKIPFGKFRDKSIPVDNVSTLDTTTDLILYAEAMKDMACEKVVNNYIMVTNLGGVKKLPGIEFNVKSKNTKYIKLKDCGWRGR